MLTFSSLGHLVLFLLPTKPGVHRPGILGAASRRCKESNSRALRPRRFTASTNTLNVLFCYFHSLSGIIAPLRTAKHAPNMLYPFHKHALLLEHRATEPLAPASLHSTFSLLITAAQLTQSQNSFNDRQQVKQEIF
ncbi:hypothetical protein Q5P01_012756 [Channa striata]|uniref:Secreted protein n=1 Tax=Channa striata TaxID=64152 RepID=A0AA88SKM1_CHASR|nr:hypothetical protein Q5P01_012756 [Channa striata]